MPWLHRTDKRLLPRVSPSDMKLRFPSEVFIDADGLAQSNANWISNPDLSAVVGFAPKYFKIVGDVVSLLTLAERDAVDADDAAVLLTNDRTRNKTLYDTEFVLKALALVMMDEVNILRQQHALPDRTIAQLRTAIRTKIDSLS